MARQSTGLLQTAGDVLNALEDCVLYRVSGPYRAESTGLSCYYSYNYHSRYWPIFQHCIYNSLEPYCYSW